MLDRNAPFGSFIDPFLEAKRFSAKGRQDYGRYLREFDQFTGGTTLIAALTPDHAIQWGQDVRRRGAHAARNGTRYLMSMAQWLADSRYLLGRDDRSVLDRIPVPKAPAASRVAFTPSELEEIWTALEERQTRDRARAIALVKLVWAAGLKTGEAESLLLRDVHLDRTGGGWIAMRATARAATKPTYLDSDTVRAVRTYMAERPPYVGRKSESFFITEDGEPFTRNGFGTWIRRVALDIKRLTPSGLAWNANLMRHTWRAEAAQPIRDGILRRRCEKFLRAIGDHDQAVREACVVLEDRVREASGATTAQFGTALMEWTFAGDPPRLSLSDHPGERRGALEMYRGIAAFYRNGTAHRVRDDFDPNDALRIVLWVDHLLGLLGDATKTQRP